MASAVSNQASFVEGQFLHPARKIEVGLLGATGTVGQQLVALLEGHPWFELTWLAASERMAGHRYNTIRGAAGAALLNAEMLVTRGAPRTRETGV